MTDGFKPAGVAFAAVVAGIAAPSGVLEAGVLQAADAAMAAREAQADALVAGAAQFAAAEPFGEHKPAQSDLFDL